jgi:hypothetical protein
MGRAQAWRGDGWQRVIGWREWTLIIVALVSAVAVVLYNDKGSWAYNLLTGQCSRTPAPYVCTHHGRGRFGQ